jgi:lysophospholipase L1-like esterase
MKFSNLLFPVALFAFAVPSHSFAIDFESKPSDPYFEKYNALPAPKTSGPLLRKGDRLAICGDSITEQRMYSRIIETYLTVTRPDLEITVRQYGWSGETAPGFLNRMTNDCLRFEPTFATTAYGMNDHGYRTYEPAIGDRYRAAQSTIIDAFKNSGARVVLGSPGAVGKVPSWTKSEKYSKEDLNLNLLELRNIDIQIAREKQVAFADVFWPMFTEDFLARQKYGADYAVPGKDGVHPGWAGQVIMAYAFLKGLGVDGDIGSITIDLAKNQVTTSPGHESISANGGEFEIKSSRYPFCAPVGDSNKDDSIRSGFTLVPFQEELNRFRLIVKNAEAPNYNISWGDETKTFSKEQLTAGINLAAEFAKNPFSDAFARVDAAVAAKQAYETRQIKELFHGPEGRADKNETADLTEKARAPLARAIKQAMVPVTYKIKIVAQ